MSATQGYVVLREHTDGSTYSAYTAIKVWLDPVKAELHADALNRGVYREQWISEMVSHLRQKRQRGGAFFSEAEAEKRAAEMYEEPKVLPKGFDCPHFVDTIVIDLTE